MKILFDQGTPVPLRAALIGHTIETAYERGWSTLSNGDLLTAAEDASFDVLITTDQNLPGEQTLSGRRLAVVVLPTTDWRQIREHTGDVVAELKSVQRGQHRTVVW